MCFFLAKIWYKCFFRAVYEKRRACDNAEARAAVVDRLWWAGGPPDALLPTAGSAH
jgi:hypothetical protein